MSFDTKYRPTTFSDVIGQDGTVQVLRQFVRSGTGRHQSYLFAGHFGSGKTTMGRILARALLCDSPVEGNPCDQCDSCMSMLERGVSDAFVEFDAATNSSKDAIKGIVDSIQYDSFSGKRRIYLMDESHRLSKEALDALLKPMEDTVPGSQDKQLVCIFCTTEPERMRSTVFSRCAPAFVIRKVTPEGLADRLEHVCRQEGIEFEREALVMIAEASDVHIRDALKSLEGVSMLGRVSVDTVRSYLRLNTTDQYLEILEGLGTDLPKVMSAVDTLLDNVSPSTAYERLAEAAMLSYRTRLGVARPPSYWPKPRLAAIAERHGDALIKIADTLASRPSNPTAAMLSCDLAVLHHTATGTWAPTHAPSYTVPVAAPAPVQPVVNPAPIPTPSPAPQAAPTPAPPPTQGKVTSGPVTAPSKAGVNVAGVYIDPRAVGRRGAQNAVVNGSVPPMSHSEFSSVLQRLLQEQGVHVGDPSA